MITIELRFPGRRYHATPWGHHVNEGLVEWPPSPWRLMRALLACGFERLCWTEPPPVARRLVERLASAAPSYVLPPATLAHSRHYMPLGTLDQDTTLVLDAWANVEGALAVRWPVELPDEERALLDELLSHLGYLGRSESWAEARLAAPGEAFSGQVVEPVTAEDEGARRGMEQIALLTPVAAGAYHDWREARVVEELAKLPPPPQKRTAAAVEKERKIRERALALYPVDLLSCLAAETGRLREQGWSQPPGTRVARYWRPRDALATVVAPRPGSRSGAVANVEVALLALATASRNDHALPPVSRALPQAEILHATLVSKLTAAGLRAPEIIGKDDSGAPLAGHRHAHVLALDLDTDGHLDHLLIWCPAGLSPEAVQAIRASRRTWAKGDSDLSLAVEALGSRQALTSIRDPRGEALARILGASQVWTSRTPFVAPRFLKRRGRNTLEGQVLAELESRGLPAARVEVIAPSAAGGRAADLRHAIITRRRGHGPPQQVTSCLKLTFATSVRGPLCLGYASHFGLGSFEHATAY